MCIRDRTLVFFPFYADVDRKHAQILICHFVVFNIVVSPCTVLVEHCFAKCEFGSCIFAGLTGKEAGFAGSVCNIKVKNLFVIVQIGSLDCICGGNSVSLVLVIYRKVGKMCLESPVRGSIKAG